MICPGPYEVMKRTYKDGEMMPESSAATFEFLYGLVRLLKPMRIVEVGSHNGVALSWLVRAAVENKNGALVVGYEIDPRLRAEAVQRLELCAPGERWQVKGDFFAEPAPVECDFCFLDIDPKSDYQRAFQRLSIAEDGMLVADDMLRGEHAADALDFSYKEFVGNPAWHTVMLKGERGVLMARRMR